jgi:predicted DNA-binding protein (MmcQ/YjbR family)
MARRFNPDHKDTLDAMLLDLPGVEPGQMFGHPSYKIMGKIFASLMETGVTLKLPEDRVQALLQEPTIAPFAPMGNPMRQWVLIEVEDAADFARYRAYFEEALQFVAAEVGKS